MARKRNRHSKLFERLRNLNGAPPAAGSIEDNFLKHLQGDPSRQIEIDNPATDGARDLYRVDLLPFSWDYDAAGTPPVQLVGASRYAMSMWFGSTPRVQIGNADALLGHNLTQALKDSASFSSTFYSALVKVTVSKNGAAPTTRTSAVTGQSYEYTPTRTSSMPFGRNLVTPEEDYVERKQAIATELKALQASNDIISFGFEPEVVNEDPRSPDAVFTAADSIAVN